jgi:hypothetical protein
MIGDVAAELEWAAKSIGATGVGDVEPVDNSLFDFVPEVPRKTFERMFAREFKAWVRALPVAVTRR